MRRLSGSILGIGLLSVLVNGALFMCAIASLLLCRFNWGFPSSCIKMATVIDLQEFEAFLVSLKDECCESVLEISIKCVTALRAGSFSEAVSFNKVRNSRLCRVRTQPSRLNPRQTHTACQVHVYLAVFRSSLCHLLSGLPRALFVLCRLCQTMCGRSYTRDTGKRSPWCGGRCTVQPNLCLLLLH